MEKPKRTKKQDDEKDPNKNIGAKPLIIWTLVGLSLLFLFQMKSIQQKDSRQMNYTEFKEAVAAQQVRTVNMSEGNVTVEGSLVNGQKFQVNILPNDPELSPLLTTNRVEINVKRTNTLFMNILFSLLPPLFLIGLLWFFFYRQVKGAGRGALSFGKSRAKMLNRDREKVKFDQVAGVDEAKEEVQEIIEYLRDPKKFQKLGGRIPKGVLLMGPPGTGKTLLAKAIAGEADVPFFSISGSDFVEMFVGVGASRVRDMFEQGKKSAPCLIFVDEIDAVGRHRGAGLGGGHDEREQTLNALLVEMDGFNTDEGVIIIAATNRPDVLDPALLRPGRFDRQIVIDLPDLKGRLGILKVHSKKVTLSRNVDLNRVARGTPGFSGADLANLINESALLAARQNKKSITMTELEEARDKVKWGRERRSRTIDEKDKKITAYHEAGHALVLDLIPECEPLHKVTIIPRGVAYLGATMQLPEKDKYHETKNGLLGQVAGLMGGRIAEEIIFGDVTSGASSDFKNATKIARLMVTEWGMSELGPITLGEREDHVFLGREMSRSQEYSEKTAQAIDSEVNRILTEGYERAKKLILDNKDKLEQVAQILLEKEVVDGEEVSAIIHGKKYKPKKEDDGEEGPASASAPEPEGPNPDAPSDPILDIPPHPQET